MFHSGGAWQDRFVAALAPLSHFLNGCFLLRYRAYAEDSSSVRHGPRAEPGEKVKHEEEEESSSSEGGRAVTSSGDEEAPPEGKKKKRSGFRDRKVPNLGILRERKLALYLSLFSERPYCFGNLLSWHVAMSFCRLKLLFGRHSMLIL